VGPGACDRGTKNVEVEGVCWGELEPTMSAFAGEDVVCLRNLGRRKDIRLTQANVDY
jgi:hypothetical protein